MSQRDSLIDATEALLWERGYEATSPRAILRRSGAGQGSMYHHFSGKEELALTALENHERALWSTTAGALSRPGIAGVMDWLSAERLPLAGCRLGRLANERAIRDNETLRAPLDRYFDKLRKLLEGRLDEARQRGELSYDVDPGDLACSLIAVVQGGFILSLATQDPSCMSQATRAACRLLERAAPWQ